MYVLVIDAGGTKTVCLLADETGRIVAEGRGPGANFHTSGDLDLERVLRQVIDQAMGDREIVPAAVCIGIAGVDREPEACLVRDIMRRIGCRAPVVVVNDALIAPRGRGRRGAGIVIIAGRARLRWPHVGGMPPGPAAGATSSATRAAVTGSAAKRCRRWVRSTARGPPASLTTC
jgi:hypothetical protein